MARIFFLRSDAQGHPDLWVTDGTSAGTKVQDFVQDGVKFPSGFTKVNNTLFFAADDGINGTELWKSDGTTASIVQDIRTGNDANGNPADSDPANLTNVNGTLYFTAIDNVHNREPWKSDGANTAIVKDISTASSSQPANLTDVNGTLFFSANLTGFPDINHTSNVVWRSNGTEAGTTPVTTVSGPDPNLVPVNPANLTNVGGTLYFSASDGISAGQHGQELWKSDGSSVQLVKDIWPGTGNGSGSSFPQGMFVGTSGGTPILYFVANDGSHGKELWESDGSEAGTVMVKDIRPGSGSAGSVSAFGDIAGPFATINGILYFFANDGIHGFQLWRSDGVPDPTGTGQGTRMVSSNLGFDDSREMVAVGNTLFLTAIGSGLNQGKELWKLAPDGSTVQLVKDIHPGSAGSSPGHLTNVGGALFFSADDGNGLALWRSDGTPATTIKIADGFFEGSQIVATDESGVVHLVAAQSDFNGDGFSDILFRNNSTGDTGYTDIHNGGFHSLGGSPVAYGIVGTGDYNGDGFSDLLFRDNSTGDTGYTDVHNGGFHSLGGSPVNYRIVGSGDYNGDGFSDLLFRDNSTGDTGYTDVHNGGFHSLGGSPVAYAIVGSGDYNGDNFSDLLFRDNSTGDSGYTDIHNGGFHSLGASPVNYSIVGSGDYNGDHFSDLLFRDNSTGDTGYTDVHNGGFHSLGGSPVNYSIVASGDYNADGFSDLLFRDNSTGDSGYTDIHNGGFHSLGGSPAAYLVIA